MKKIEWFERQFVTGQPAGMLPFFIDRLEGTVVRIRAKISNVPDQALAETLEGKWSIKQTLATLRISKSSLSKGSMKLTMVCRR